MTTSGTTMKFTTDHRDKLKSMLAAKAITASEKAAIRAALERIEELEENAGPSCKMTAGYREWSADQ